MPFSTKESLARTATGRRRQRERILEAASWLFAERGYASVTIDDIADRIGATKGIVYYYFRSKADILYQAHLAALKEISSAFADLMHPGEPPRARLEKALRRHAAQVIANRPLVRMLMRTMEVNDEGVLHPDQRSTLRREREAYESLFARILEEGVTAGELAPGRDPRLWAKFVIGAINSTVHWFNPAGRIDQEAMIDLMVDTLMRGTVVRDETGREVKP